MRGGADTMSLPNHPPIRALTEKSLTGGSPSSGTAPARHGGGDGKASGKGGKGRARDGKGDAQGGKGSSKGNTGSRQVYIDDSSEVPNGGKAGGKDNRWRKVRDEQGGTWESRSY